MSITSKGMEGEENTDSSGSEEGAEDRISGQEIISREANDVKAAEKSELNFELLEGEDAASARVPMQPVYQIRPPLAEKFKPLSVKEVIHNVLFDQLSTKTYDVTVASQWSKEIADIIRVKVKELKFRRYKYIVNVVLGEQHGAGLKMGTRCLWDTEADSYAHDNFANETLFCVATVYAIYLY